MIFLRKRRQNKKEGRRYLHIMYTDKDIEQLYKEACKDLDEALDLYEKDVMRTCRREGFYRSEVLAACYDDVKEWIKKLWEE